MKALTKILAGGVVAAALFGAAPAAAQYYPSPYGYGSGGVIGQVINQVLGGGLGGYGGYGQSGYGYGVNSQAAVGQCVNAVQARLARSGYGSHGGYNGGYGQARVLGISRVEQRSNGGLTIRGVASSGMNAGYSAYGGYGGQQPVDLTFRCRTDYRGFVVDVDVNRAQTNYGTNYQPYGNYQSQDPYAAYGYRRY